MWHAWERREKCTRFWWESPKEREYLDDQGVDGRIGSEWILRRMAGGVQRNLLAGSCEYCDEHDSSGATELVTCPT
jgi:hypothetical protein